MPGRKPLFSIDSVEYRYPVSSNPYQGKLKDLGPYVVSDQETEAHRGQVRQLFNQKETTPLEIEIGCNAGHWLIPRAQQNPDCVFIGIDWKFKAIHRAAEKAEKRQVPNVKFFRAHAVRLPFMFGPNELDRVSVFFPDPWPKKSQKKNRLLQAEFLKRIHSCIKNGGILHIKTDHREYFDFILEWLPDVLNHYEVISKSFNVYGEHPAPHLLPLGEVTLFERLFIKDGLPIHELILKTK